MPITIAILRAAGASAAFILRVVELEEAERRATKREQNRKNQQKQRARQQISADSADAADASFFLKKELKKDTSKKARKGVRGKPMLIPLPDDWQPKGPQRDPTEPDEFRDKARARGWTYANWDAAYRNFQKSEFNHRNKNGEVTTAPRVRTDAEAHAYLKEIQAEIEREKTNGTTPKAQAGNGHSKVGDGRQCDAPQLRLEGGALDAGGQERSISDAISAIAKQASRG